MYKFIFLVLFLCFFQAYQVFSQNVVVSDDASYTGNSSAILDINSTSKGFLMPRLTLAQRNALGNPAVGTIVYQTDEFKGLYLKTGPTSLEWNCTYSDPGAGFTLLNTVFGMRDLSARTPITGASNTAFGTIAGNVISTGAQNVFVGAWSGYVATSASRNVCVGKESGRRLTNATNNVFIGHRAGSSVITGSGNVIIGNDVLGLSGTTNSLLINNSSGTPLIVGSFANKTLTVNNALILPPTSTEPTSPGAGMLIDWNGGVTASFAGGNGLYIRNRANTTWVLIVSL